MNPVLHCCLLCALLGDAMQAYPHRRELKGTFCGMATSDREGRDGVNPSTTHLCVVQEEMWSRGGLSPRDPRGRRELRLPPCR